VTGALDAGKGWVTGAFSGAAGWLTSAAKDIVTGLANGLRNNGGLISSAASYLASLVPDTVKSLLGINSPAKVMIPLGSSVPEGVGVGMLGGAHFITSAGSQLADVTAQSLAGIAAGQSASALSALGVPSIASPARLPGVNAALSGGPLQLQLSYAGSGNQLVDALVGSLRADIQGKAGGDVQAHLGQGAGRIF